MRQPFQCINAKGHHAKQQCRSCEIERLLLGRTVLGNYPQCKRDCCNTDGDVDQKDPVPGEVMRENPAERRTRGKSDRACHRENSESKTEHSCWKTFDAEHRSSRGDHGCTDSLKHSCAKETVQIRGETTGS